jgi:hypothetical protein
MTKARASRCLLLLGSCASSLLPACAPNADPSVVGSIASAITPINEYARRCDEVIRDDNDQPASVPAFFCEDGTDVPQNTTYSWWASPSVKCDYPNRLNSECDPGSKFQVLHDDKSSTIVAHCRKKGWLGHVPGDGHFGDIAVIQYSKTNGATCFYQAGPANDLFPGLDSMNKVKPVPAPSNDPNQFWDSPANANGCITCHNSGPLIRSQYLAQLNQASTGKDALPEQIDFHTSNHLMHRTNAPYWFPGSDFSSYHVYSVELPNNICMSCHRLGITAKIDNGVSSFSTYGTGTAVTFGPESVLAPPQIRTQNSLRPDPSNAGRFLPERWMIPPGDDQSPDPTVVQAANDVRDCALSQAGQSSVAAPAGCTLVDFTSPASVQLSLPDKVICSEGATVAVGVKNMNSPLTGTLTVDGTVTHFSTAVGQLEYQTWVPFASTGAKQISVSVTDANGRSATNSINPRVESCNFGVSNNQTLYVVQGSLASWWLTMSGPWVDSDGGVNAQGALVRTDMPGATFHFGPGYTNPCLYPIVSCSASMDLTVGASLSTPVGDYTATVQATDLASGMVRTTTVSITVEACRPPPTSCAGDLCGAFTGCGESLQCGSCSGTNVCSSGHCCPPDTIWDGDACVPPCNCPKGYYCDASGQCVRNSHCRPGTCM